MLEYKMFNVFLEQFKAIFPEIIFPRNVFSRNVFRYFRPRHQLYEENL